MHVMIRLLPGMPGQAGRFAVHRSELEQLMASVPGLVSYHLIETDEGVAAVVVSRDRAGCEECEARGARWMDARLPDLAGRGALVVWGDVIAAAVPG